MQNEVLEDHIGKEVKFSNEEAVGTIVITGNHSLLLHQNPLRLSCLQIPLKLLFQLPFGVRSTNGNNLGDFKGQEQLPCLLPCRLTNWPMLSLGANAYNFSLNLEQRFPREVWVLSDARHQAWQRGYLPGGPRGPAWPGGPGGPGSPGTGVETLNSPLGP